MVPDNASVIKAVEYSLIEAWFTRKMLAGKITRDKVDWASRERNWYVAQSGASTSQHNLDQRQTLANIATTLFTNNNHHDTDYTGLGSNERRRDILMPQQVYTYQNGMNRDLSKTKTPNTQYYDAENIRIISNDAESSFSI